MVGLASVELSYVASKTLGIPFSLPALHDLLDVLLDAYKGNGPISADGSNLLQSLNLNSDTSREVILRRFRMQAERACHQTSYYAELFAKIGLDPAALTWDDISQIPLTPKEAARDQPYDFLCRDSKPVFLNTTTGTTGRPTSVYFSEYEIEVSTMTGAIFNILIRDIVPEDIYLLCTSSRATLGNMVAMGICTRIGALPILGGVVDPEITLAMLAEERRIPGKKPKVSEMLIGPSYLGRLVETGLSMGYKPSDFGLWHIDIGGEVSTEGVKRRAKELFGDVVYYDAWGMTETWSTGAVLCEEGHLHFGNTGLIEFINPDTGKAAGPGEVASVVATMLPPYRDTTLFIRYDTQDMVRMLDVSPTCSMSKAQATSPMLGKLSLSVRHENGWTYPRDVLEALESLDVVPLPARCGFWSVPGGVAVEVVARNKSATTRRAIEQSLEEHGVPLKELHIRENRSLLEHPYPYRGDLHETSFGMPTISEPVPAKSNGHKARGGKRAGKGG